MVATDTVVGVAGAVILAAVMVGVFVYEYNNAPASTTGGSGMTDQEKVTSFAAAHPNLAASDDIDSDGLANYNDTDLDNAGGPDANQTGNFVVHGMMQGSTAPPPGADHSQEKAAPVGKGGLGMKVYLNYTPTVPPLAQQLPRIPAMELFVDGPDGTPAGTAQSSTNGSGVVMLTVTIESLQPGNYTVRVEQTQAGPETPYTAQWTIDYGSAKSAA